MKMKSIVGVLKIIAAIFCFVPQNIQAQKNAAAIDLSHWKITIPAGEPEPINVGYPELSNFDTNPVLKNFMYNDFKDKSIVFYAFPSGVTTANSSFSRSELREQMELGKDSPNWTFKDGGRMKGTLRMGEVSKDEKGKYHKVIIMQIHGRLSKEQAALIDAKDGNAPPMLKISWENGKVVVKVKKLKDPNVSDIDILRYKSWIDDEKFIFNEKVDFDKFTLEVKVSDGRLEVILNNSESKVFEGHDLKKWNVFENYFKAGNYFQTHDKGAFARVKYYSLEVSH